MTCKVIKLFNNTPTADDKYFLLSRENLMQPIQSYLSQKQKKFYHFFCGFLKSTSNFEHFEQKMTLHSLFIFEITGSERRG